MSFVSEASKVNSERAILCKITPARYIGDDLASIGGGIYETSWSYDIERIERNGQILTEDSVAPTVNDHWFWDGSNLQVKLAAAPSASNVIVVFYNLYYSSNANYTIAYKDPEATSGEQTIWEPRLQNSPKVKQTVKNIITGTITSSISQLNIVNTDHVFEQYLTDNDSFFEKSVSIWSIINGTENIQKLFFGKITKISLSENTVSLTLYDIFSLLDQPALFGDTLAECYWTLENWPNMYPQHDGRPIRMVLMERTTNFASDRGDTGITWPATVQTTEDDYTQILEATCTDYTHNGGGTDNRTWGICRFDSSGPRTLDWGTITAIVQKTLVGTTVDIGLKTSSDFNIRQGDSVTVINGGIPCHGICLVDTNYTYDFGSGSDTYQILCRLDCPSGIPTFTTSDTFVESQAPSVAYFIDKRFDPGSGNGIAGVALRGAHLNYTVSNTSSGNKYGYVTFFNNFETSTTYGVSSYFTNASNSWLDPAFFRVFFIWGAAADLNHAEIVNKICSYVGIPVNSASIATAKAALSSNVAFTVPFKGENKIQSYRNYLENICSSTAGIVFGNSNFELEYKLLSTPSSTDLIDSNSYTTVNASLSYQDIVTEVQYYNRHIIDDQRITAASTPSSTVSSDIPKYLHGISNAIRREHVLDEITTRKQDIFNIISNRTATYRFVTPTRDLTTELGDDIKLESDKILGGSGSSELKVISINKGVDSVEIEATDLLDI